ncbi:ankyrin, partial [Terfezia boudieri ATCC MYA-4762]
EDGTMPLHIASAYGHQEVAKLLIDGGANVSAGKRDGTTPLYIASQNRHQGVAKLLIDRGA